MKKSLEIVSLHSDVASSDKDFWATQTPQARLQYALELRRINYGTDRVSSRLQRVLEITQRPPR